MSKYQCLPCGYIYDEKTNKDFEALAINWVCPECGAGKHDFDKIEEKTYEQSI